MNRVLIFLISAFVPALITANNEATSNSFSTTQTCILPEYPEHGTYSVLEDPSTKPGQSVETATLNYTCQEKYGIVGPQQIFCVIGFWIGPLPECKRFCKLETNPSVEYKCIISDGEGYRTCEEYEPRGTIVRPECRAPNYYSQTLRQMTCVDGTWDYVAKCDAECGRIPPEDVSLITGGHSTRPNWPWHAGIYTKTTKTYKQLCGGTLISTSVVISAAHCFWSLYSMRPIEEFAVALGKKYRSWDNKHEVGVHKSDVVEIHIPPYFIGEIANYQNDIAVVVMEQEVVYNANIRPICLNFDIELKKTQLRNGNLGKIGGWSIDTNGNKRPSPVLKVVEIPYIDVETCIAEAPILFRPFITVDKICAGPTNGTAFCGGNSGGGLAFPSKIREVDRYYLRGVMSAAPQIEVNKLCQDSLITFTHISIHEHFIKEHLPRVDF